MGKNERLAVLAEVLQRGDVARFRPWLPGTEARVIRGAIEVRLTDAAKARTIFIAKGGGDVSPRVITEP